MIATDVARVFLVDDHPVVRTSLRRLFESDRGVLVVGEASSGEEALAKIPAARPDLAIVDIAMDGMDGIELTSRLRATQPQMHILIASMHEGSYYVAEALAAGADGYVLKKNAPELLTAAVNAVLDGQSYLCDDMRRKLNQ